MTRPPRRRRPGASLLQPAFPCRGSIRRREVLWDGVCSSPFSCRSAGSIVLPLNCHALQRRRRLRGRQSRTRNSRLTSRNSGGPLQPAQTAGRARHAHSPFRECTGLAAISASCDFRDRKDLLAAYSPASVAARAINADRRRTNLVLVQRLDNGMAPDPEMYADGPAPGRIARPEP